MSRGTGGPSTSTSSVICLPERRAHALRCWKFVWRTCAPMRHVARQPSHQLRKVVTMNLSPRAGNPAPRDILVNVPRLITAYYKEVPDPSVASQRVAFGTSGHRGSAFDAAFNEWHILAITQGICEYRKKQGTDGPLFLGMDTHGLSVPAIASALDALAANGVVVMLAVEG